MKVWLVEIFVYNCDDEYGHIMNHYRENKVFDQKVKALNYMRDFKNTMKNESKKWDFYYKYGVYPPTCIGNFHNESEITEIEL